MIREPAVCGTFYPNSQQECRNTLEGCFAEHPTSSSVEGRIVGGIVPHAGWMCSGKVTAAVFAAIAVQRSPETFIVFGAVHRVRGRQAALFGGGRWETPLGPISIDGRLAERVASQTNLVIDDPYAHEPEHSIEVQVPFIQLKFPDAKLLPIMVPPGGDAPEVGRAVARTIQAYRYDAVVVGSSDLTHYGPRYGFTPEGGGPQGLEWAKNVNDRRVIEAMLSLDADGIVPETAEHRNACGGGAIAAAIAASSVLGADRGVLLEHTTSREVLGPSSGDDAVGYAGIVFAEPAP